MSGDNFPQNIYDLFGGPGSAERDTEKRKELEALYAPYRRALKEYGHHAQENRWQFHEDNPNIGYKFHLNVSPEDVQMVSKFLIENDYEHKYLSGGELEDGKVFTVYTGSKEQTERIAQEVSNGIGSLLQTPNATGEVPFAPNIVGRFVGRGDEFQQYGRNGVSYLSVADWKDPETAFSSADKVLRERYGKYYGGGITPYQPISK